MFGSVAALGRPACLWKPLVLSLLLAVPSLSLGEVRVEAWVQRYSNLVNSDDQAKKIAADSTGVVVAGCTDDGISGQDMLIIKYSNEGVPLWTNRYNGPANDHDVVNMVAMDRHGDVFITGASVGSGSGSDSVTIGYSNTGVPLWTNRYNGEGVSGDIANAIAVDNAGTVVVTGSSKGDFVTIAYSTAGIPLWTNRYNGPGNGSDVAIAVGADQSGNVFVTGSSAGNGSGDDFATIAYSNTGVPLWTNRYSVQGNSSDIPKAMAVDNTGNVVVTGTSGTGIGSDFVTIKYSGMGMPLWTNRYNGTSNGGEAAHSVAVDQSGNVFITGHSVGTGSGIDFATIGYSNTGVPLWTNRYSGPGFSSDIANGIAVDNENVVVAGSSSGNFATVSYSKAGIPVWTNRYNGPANGNDWAIAVVIRDGGDLFIAGSSWSGSSVDLATIAYSRAGLALWTNRYDAIGNGRDFPQALAADSGGNVIVTGESAGIGTGLDFATIKYSSDGVPLWTNRYNGLGNTTDSSVAIAVGTNESIFVTGSTWTMESSDFATIAYSNTGMPMWTNLYDGPANQWDSANAVAVDISGNVYVTGTSTGIGSEYDYTTIKYSSGGVALWTNRYDGQRNSFDFVRAIAVDSNENVFVTGLSYRDATNVGYVTIAYSSAGTPMWTNSYFGSGGWGADPVALAVTGSGNVIVTGYSSSEEGNDDYTTIAYSAMGVSLWTNRYHGAGTGRDAPVSLAVDAGGNIFVTGSSAGIINKRDIAAIAYSSTGVALWTNRYLGPGNSDDFARSVAVDSNGNVLVLGYSSSSNSGYNYVTIKYSNTGIPLSTNLYNGPANGDDFPQGAFSLAIAPNGDVFVTGASDGNVSSGTTYDFATLKYASVPQPFELVSPARLSNGNFGFIFTAVSRLNYRIDASTDLLSWTSLTNVFYSNSPIQFMDLEATNFPRRFYRALWNP